MINIDREVDSPSSLNKPIIQQYIVEVHAHLNDPTNVPKPDIPVAYRTSDLLEAFDRNFFSKCYLTEEKYINSWIMDVEHFVPQNEQPELVYEWTNLFPASHYANMIKPRTTPAGGYLNPCEVADNVETEIIYTLSKYGQDPFFEASNHENIKALNTCNLLLRLHNGHDDPTKKATADLRHAIQKKYIDILNKIIDFQRYPDNSQEKAQALRELRDHLSRKSSFTMLCRSIPAVRQLQIDIFD